MAGTSFRVDVDDRAVRRALARLTAAGADMTPAMNEIGSMLEASTSIRFERQVDPQGNPWTPLSEATARRRHRAKDGSGRIAILQDSGRLRDSIVSRAGPDFVEVGTNVVYAAIHQFGGRAGRGRAARIPARPFLGVDAGDEAEIGNILADFIEEAFR